MRTAVNNERGSVLIVAVIAMLIMGVLSVSFAFQFAQHQQPRCLCHTDELPVVCSHNREFCFKELRRVRGPGQREHCFQNVIEWSHFRGNQVIHAYLAQALCFRSSLRRQRGLDRDGRHVWLRQIRREHRTNNDFASSAAPAVLKPPQTTFPHAPVGG